MGSVNLETQMICSAPGSCFRSFVIALALARHDSWDAFIGIVQVDAYQSLEVDGHSFW